MNLHITLTGLFLLMIGLMFGCKEKPSGLDAKIINSYIVLKNDSVYCDLEIWHEVEFLNYSEDSLFFKTNWNKTECLKESEHLNKGLLAYSKDYPQNEDAIFYFLFKDSLFFKLSISGQLTENYLLPHSSKSLIFGMENKYDKSIEMVENIFFEFLKGDFIIGSFSEIGNYDIIIGKSDKYQIEYIVNGSIVSKNQFVDELELDFM